MGTSSEMSTSNSHVKYNISIFENGQSREGNYSNVTVRVYFWRNNTGYETHGSGTISCKIDGTTYTENVSSSQKITSSGITLFEKNLNITHNSDGTKTLTTSAWINIDAPLSSSEQSYSQQLTTITPEPAPSSIAEITTCGNFEIENEHYIEYTNASSSRYYSLYIQAKNPNSSEYVTVCVVPGYQSGQRITFTEGQIGMIYDMIYPNVVVNSPVDVGYHLETYESQGGRCLGESPRYVTGYIKKGNALITETGDCNIEGEHSVAYKKYRVSENLYYKLWSESKKAGTGDENYVTIENITDDEGYQSGQNVPFAGGMICYMYNQASPDTKPGCYLDIRQHIETWESKGQNFIGESVRVVKGYISGSTFTKVNGEWKKCVPYVKVGDSWKPTLGYTKVNGEWKQGIT